MKKFFLTTIALFMLSATGFAQSGTTGPLTWELSDGTLTVSGTGAMPSYSSPDYAPWFAYRSSIKTVVIGDDVTSIGNYAFILCSSLTSITIPNSVKSIGSYAFISCSGLTEITIPNGVTIIGTSTFDGCRGLTEITIPNSVTSIGNYAFDGCSRLTEITVPESVTSIGNNVFNGCTGLTSFTNLNPTPQSIISNVFQNIDLTKVTLYVPAESMEAYKAAEVWTNFGNILSKTGPLAWGISDGTLTVSGEGAMPDYSWNSAPWYSYRSSITTVVIGDGVTSIGDNAFSDCSKLTSVTIGNSVISIGYRAFYYCSELTSVTISNSVTSIGEQAFYDCSKLTSVTIGNSVTSIGDWAFRGCSELTSVTIPSSVTSISGNPFYDCIALTAIDVSEDNTAYASENGILFNKEKSALIRYPAAKQDASYTIPSSVTSIGDGAFERCSNLTSVTIPNSVTSIGDYAFAYCTGLASVTNRNPAPQSINSDVFQNVDLINATLYVPASSIEDYEAAAVWTNFGNIVSALPIFHVSVTANNPSMGTVAGTGDYEENSTATISATANPGYRFVKWDDDDTQNPRTITVTQDTTCTAIFEAITYHVTVTANNTSMGTVDGTGDYEENSTVTISATANPGYRFVKWDDDDTQNPRTITVTQDTTYTAIFDVNTNIQQTSDNGISIYPNPVTESFRINGITAPTEVIITDLSGRIVLQQTTEGGEYVAAGNLPNGVYLVRVNGKTLKVVKK